MRNELPFFWNELTILWNDLPIDWNDLTMEWNDHNLRPCDLFFFLSQSFGFFSHFGQLFNIFAASIRYLLHQRVIRQQSTNFK